MLLVGSLMFVASFLAQCGPEVAPATTRAVIQVESQENPLAINDNTAKKTFAPRSKEEAVARATELLSQGHNLDLGLMQVNSTHLAPLGLSAADLFDPCTNIRAGTGILAAFYRQQPTKDPSLALFRALSAYNRGRPSWRGSNYVNKILEAAGVPYRVLLMDGDGKEAVSGAPPSPPQSTETSPLFFGEADVTLFTREGF